jgi:hypothetical protein
LGIDLSLAIIAGIAVPSYPHSITHRGNRRKQTSLKVSDKATIDAFGKHERTGRAFHDLY